MINSRGSLEQMFSQFMTGPPHDEHHDCRRLTWQLDNALEAAVDLMFASVNTLLRAAGVFMVHANGATNEKAADELLRERAERHDLDLTMAGPRLHKWIKR